MVVAERLYTQGYISYPRTETTHYPPNFDFNPVVRLYQNSQAFGEAARQILSDGFNPRKGDDAGDHPPITPQEKLWKFIILPGHVFSTSDCDFTKNISSLMNILEKRPSKLGKHSLQGVMCLWLFSAVNDFWGAFIAKSRGAITKLFFNGYGMLWK